MDVKETLAFSARCQGVGSRYDMLAELTRRKKVANIKPDPNIDVYMKAVATKGDEANVITYYILKVLGLDICADTLVGSDMLREISGGQRKRVTTGMYSHEFTFCEKVKERLRSADDYQAFLKCLHIYSTKIITRKELQSLL